MGSLGLNMIIGTKVTSLNDCYSQNIPRTFQEWFVWKLKKIPFDLESCSNILLCKYMLKKPPSKYVKFQKSPKNKKHFSV